MLPSAARAQAPVGTDRAVIEFELFALRRCAHAHVVRLLAAADVGADTYVAMERCGGDCMEFIASAPRLLPERVVAKMMRQVCARRRAPSADCVALRCARRLLSDSLSRTRAILSDSLCRAHVPSPRSSPPRSRTCTLRESCTWTSRPPTS